MSGYGQRLQGGSGTKQLSLQSGFTIQAVSNDTIIYSHTINFRRPTPGENLDWCQFVPGSTDEGYTRNLGDYPLDDEPSGGNCPCMSSVYNPTCRISPSEMALTHFIIENYSTPAQGYGTIKMSWMKKGSSPFFTLSWFVPAPDPGWTWWYYEVWSFTGRFSWEINTSGDYQCLIETSWGNTTIDFTVTAPPLYQVYTSVAEGFGTVLACPVGGSGCADNVLVEPNAMVEFRATPAQGYVFAKWVYVDINGTNYPSWENPLLTSIGQPGTMNVYFQSAPSPITLLGAHFVKNGVVDLPDCTATTADNISFEASVSGLIIGRFYSAEWKIKNNDHPEWGETSFYSTYVVAAPFTSFNSTSNQPLVSGSYQITWFIVYDELGIPVWAGAPL